MRVSDYLIIFVLKDILINLATGFLKKLSLVAV